MPNNLKEVFLKEKDSIIPNSGIKSKDLEKKLLELTDNRYSKTTVQMFVARSTVNSPQRQFMGPEGDWLVKLDDSKLHNYNDTEHSHLVIHKKGLKKFLEEHKALLLDDEIRQEGNPGKRTLIIGTCTSSKTKDGPVPAYKRYVGIAMRSFKDLIETYEDFTKYVDLRYFSAGLGLVPYDYVIDDYNLTFHDVDRKDWPKLKEELTITKDIMAILEEGDYEEAIFCLSKAYDSFVDYNKILKKFPSIKFLNFSKNYSKLDNMHYLKFTDDQFSKIGYTKIGMKSYIIKRYIEDKGCDKLTIKNLMEYVKLF